MCWGKALPHSPNDKNPGGLKDLRTWILALMHKCMCQQCNIFVLSDCITTQAKPMHCITSLHDSPDIICSSDIDYFHSLHPSATPIKSFHPDMPHWLQYTHITKQCFPIPFLLVNSSWAAIHQPEGLTRVNTIHLAVDVPLQWAMSLFRGLAELPAEIGIVTFALGYPDKWCGAGGGAVSQTAARTATKMGVSPLVAQVGLYGWKVHDNPDYP